jgi:hypothetical protein
VTLRKFFVLKVFFIGSSIVLSCLI